MSNVKKPAPVAWVIYEPITKKHILSEVELQTKYLDDGTIAYSVSPVVFQSQSEAYANALAAKRVREALEKAAGICKELQCSPELTPEVKDNWLAIAEKRIRELMQKGI